MYYLTITVTDCWAYAVWEDATSWHQTSTNTTQLVEGGGVGYPRTATRGGGVNGPPPAGRNTHPVDTGAPPVTVNVTLWLEPLPPVLLSKKVYEQVKVAVVAPEWVNTYGGGHETLTVGPRLVLLVDAEQG